MHFYILLGGVVCETREARKIPVPASVGYDEKNGSRSEQLHFPWICIIFSSEDTKLL